jgi:hypothetical protein
MDTCKAIYTLCGPLPVGWKKYYVNFLNNNCSKFTLIYLSKYDFFGKFYEEVLRDYYNIPE